MSPLFTLDDRYTTNLEYCGYETPKYVSRFCDVFIGNYDTKEIAQKKCYEHFQHRMKFLLD
tara:strand:- start:742 stop:924 length:183 start_codon:yes stop_codon:yes gene_type:complete